MIFLLILFFSVNVGDHPEKNSSLVVLIIDSETEEAIGLGRDWKVRRRYRFRVRMGREESKREEKREAEVEKLSYLISFS